MAIVYYNHPITGIKLQQLLSAKTIIGGAEWVVSQPTIKVSSIIYRIKDEALYMDWADLYPELNALALFYGPFTINTTTKTVVFDHIRLSWNIPDDAGDPVGGYPMSLKVGLTYQTNLLTMYCDSATHNPNSTYTCYATANSVSITFTETEFNTIYQDGGFQEVRILG